MPCYRPLSDADHFDAVRRTRAELEEQLKVDFPAVSRVEWKDDDVRALSASGALLAHGPSLATIRSALSRKAGRG